MNKLEDYALSLYRNKFINNILRKKLRGRRIHACCFEIICSICPHWLWNSQRLCNTYRSETKDKTTKSSFTTKLALEFNFGYDGTILKELRKKNKLIYL